MKKELTFTVLVGPPGVGKTTWRTKNVTEDDAVLSNDDILLSLCDTPHDYNKCWQTVNQKTIRQKFNTLFNEATKNKKNIIVDTTNMRSKRRRKLLARVGKDYTKIAVVFNWERKILLERNENRNTSRENKMLRVETIDDFIDNYQSVNKKEEGFDKIISVPFINKKI